MTKNSMPFESISELELPGFEKSCCLYGNWITICHAAHLTGDQSIVINNIQSVVTLLLKRYSRLRSQIDINGYRHSLKTFDYNENQIDINLFYSIVQLNDQSSWEKIVEDKCNQNPFSNNGQTIYPLFHFMLLVNEKSSLSNNDRFHLLLFSDHCASDGYSGYILLNDFLTLITSSDLHEKQEPVNNEVVPFLTRLVPCNYGPIFRIMSWIRQRLYEHEARKLAHLRIPAKQTQINEQLKLQPIRNHFLFTSSSSTLYTRLHDKCRSQNVTINGPLFGCLLLAIHDCFPMEKNPNRYLTPFMVEVAVNMRSRFSHPSLTSQSIGCNVSIADLKLKKKLELVSTPFWSLVKMCMNITNETLQSSDLRTVLHSFDYILQKERRCRQLYRYFPNGITGEVCLSNLGKYPYSCNYQNQLQLHGLHLVNSMSIYRLTAIVFITCVGDGQLDFSLSHMIESEEKAQDFFNRFVRLVETCADANIDITLEQLLNSTHAN